jgi:hypothetical protein
MLSAVICLCSALVAPGSAGPPEPSLPVVTNVPVDALRDQCWSLLQLLEKRKADFPERSLADLRALLNQNRSDTDWSVEIQRLLDAHCLIAVTINPESRVKAVRGPAPARLRQGKETIVLIKVANEAGVTQAIKVSGPQLLTSRGPGQGRWLEAKVDLLGKTLSGQRLEYVLLRLTAHEPGKREATLGFDVGQGTQDLGFRAEVPILFTIAPARP